MAPSAAATVIQAVAGAEAARAANGPQRLTTNYHRPMAGPSRELYRAGSLAVGTFRCRPGDDAFDGGWIEHPTIVFPRTCVKITQEGTDTVLADPNTVVLYRGGQEYSRAAVDSIGDHCEWFEVDPAWMREAAAPYDPELTAPDAPAVRHTHAPSQPEAYVLQRSLTRMLGAAGPAPTGLVVEEALLRLVDLVIPPAYVRRASVDAVGAVGAEHVGLVDDAKAHMALNFNRPLSLSDIGAAVGSSRFHLARVFRRTTGTSLHRYLTSLRLRAALNRMTDSSEGLADIAVAVGFSSHSHLTQAFRQAFGTTPSRYRRQPEAFAATM